MAEKNTAGEAETEVGIVVAITSTIVRGRGDERTVVRAGEAWAADDPFVAAHPEMFSADADRARRGPADAVEQKTARPADVVEEKTARPGRKAQVKPRD